MDTTPDQNRPSAPLWLLAELTYRCPLHCAFCYNPVDFATHGAELDTDAWRTVISEARALGAAQIGFSGGEPLLRDDLEELVGHARSLGFYTNLITSGGPERDAHRAAQGGRARSYPAVAAGFDARAERLSHQHAHLRPEARRRAAHQAARLPDGAELRAASPTTCRTWGRSSRWRSISADFLELANTQYYGWAMLNRDQLMPTAEQLRGGNGQPLPQAGGRALQILFVVPDYFEQRPKACMNGWGSVFLGVAPDGAALPCHAARSLPGLTLPNVREQSLKEIWYDSDAFNAFRGDGWMREPCRTCDERHVDHGGCRCQAYMLAGDPAEADPVCSKSAHHGRVEQAVQFARREQRQDERPLVFRSTANSLGL
jgi:pyrroloquinoline quinone biosynthesis protein E